MRRQCIHLIRPSRRRGKRPSGEGSLARLRPAVAQFGPSTTSPSASSSDPGLSSHSRADREASRDRGFRSRGQPVRLRKCTSRLGNISTNVFHELGIPVRSSASGDKKRGMRMDLEYIVFGALMAFIIVCRLADPGRRTPSLERAMNEQLRRSSDTIRGAPLE